MQSNLCCARSCFSWNPEKTKIVLHNFELQQGLLNNPSPKPKIDKLKTSINFLKTSLSFGEDKLNKQQEEETTVPFYLPVSVRNSNSHFRYIWDGKDLKLVSVDGNALSISDLDSNFEDTLQKLVRICISAIRNFFLPREVSRNYLEYVKWKFVHRVSSSALQVLATQAMLRAIGIGHSRSLPLAAALNWVLKDGLGRLCRCIYTASLASSFDTNLKRVRFCTSVLFSLSIGVELLTPVFPQYFLMLASIANIAKQISLACYLATSTAVHRSFAIADNLGEVSAKGQIQTVCFDNLGLTLAATLNILSVNSPRLQAGLPFVMYPIFAVLDLFGIYQGLQHVHLQTLTKDRLDIIISTWIQQGFVPSPEEVSKKEGIGLFWSRGREPWSIRIGCLNPRCCTAKLSVMTMQSLNSEDFYFLSPESLTGELKRNQEYGVLLSLREGAGTIDVIRGILHASYVRKGIEACGSSNAVLKQWFNLVEDGRRLTEQNLSLFYEHMLSLGWACKNILLSTQEQARYSFIAD
ncbi:protein root UVB sensitive 4-like [Capsicum chacoense]|uniref:Protein root UVB sensitive 4 n=1 Tax=Capsicum annuum TaxID=4072 RepID=A0A1U8FR98_CAPAN|nr:protein root UVB sensitive 4 [Capsicum annuum]XP_047262027.1 protein root UVB sensitive 4-like [Capsicum annuum]XP_047262055.1 protein root UVB sensitive 4-like [Capsicum annuum]KAF3651368.1 Protein root UVB sensitive 4 [Capsicum annuum]KAF3659537.1 Protein root UVB sensitive 4 [Capsicum annuum]PHT89585.1 Protein root UVB sensitive 4 [Capsicum annuum]